MRYNAFFWVALFFLTSHLCFANICTWTGGIGDWNNPSNWDCGIVPGSADTVYLSNGTINLDMDRQISFLKMTGGLISGNDSLIINDTLSWSAGNFSGIRLKTQSGSNSWIGGTSTKYVNAGIHIIFEGNITHESTIINISQSSKLIIAAGADYQYNGGRIEGSGLDSLINNGNMDIGFDAIISGIFFNFINNGNLTKSAGTGTLNLDCSFIQNASFIYNSGNKIRFYNATFSNGSSSSLNSGTIQFDQNATIDTFSTIINVGIIAFNGSNMTLNGTIPSTTKLDFLKGNVFLNSNHTAEDTVWMKGGNLAGSGKIILAEYCLWTGGEFKIPVEVSASANILSNGSTTRYLSGNGSLKIFGVFQLDQGSLGLNMDDTVHIESGAKFYYNGGLISGSFNEVIFNSGALDIGFDAKFEGIFMQLINEGIIQKTGGTGQLNFNCSFTNNGTLNLLTGNKVRFYTVYLNNGSTNIFSSTDILFDQNGLVDTFASITGGHQYIFSVSYLTLNSTLPSNKQLRFESGTTYFNTDFNSSDTIWIDGSLSISGTGSISTNGVCYWNGGSIKIPFVSNSASTMYLHSGSHKAIEGIGSLRLFGKLYLGAGTFYLTNTDTIHIENSGEFYFDGGTISGGNNQILINKGLLEISFDATITNGGFRIINEGTLRKTAGVGLLNLDCNLTNYGTLDLGTGSAIRFHILNLENGSSAIFGLANVKFDGSLLLDTFALISGGKQYIFSGYTNMTVNGSIPNDKQLVFESNNTYFNFNYYTSDTIWIIGPSTVKGNGRINSNGVTYWSVGDIELPFESGPLAKMFVSGSAYKTLKGIGRLDLKGTLYMSDGTLYLVNSDSLYIHNTGQFYFDGGTISGGNNQTIYNEGSFEVSFDATITNIGLDFINNGSFTKTGGLGLLNLDCNFLQIDSMAILSGKNVRFTVVNFINNSKTHFNSAIVQFEFTGGTVDTFANIYGGSKFIFKGSNIYLNGNLPANKQLEFISGTTYFNQPYETLDTIWIINGNIAGTASLKVNGYCSWTNGSIHLPFICGLPGKMVLSASNYKQFKSSGRLDLYGVFLMNEGIFSIGTSDSILIQSSGEYYFNGGTIDGGGGQVIKNKGLFSATYPGLINSGQLKFLNYGIFESDQTGGILDINCQFINSGLVRGNNSIDFVALDNQGTIAPGFSIDTLTILPDLDNTNSSILIEISGNEGPGVGNDLLHVPGPINLEGELEVQLIDGFTADTGYCYTIITSGTSIIDSFDIYTFPTTQPEWKVLYYSDSLVVQYFYIECPSDITMTTEPDLCYTTISDQSLDLVSMESCGDVSIKNDVNGTPSLLGEVFYAGDHTIKWTVFDGHGDSLTCEMILSVEDQQSPQFNNCPSNVGPISTNYDGMNNYDCSTIYSWLHPSLTDNCDLGSGQTIFSYSLSGATNLSSTTVSSYDGSTMASEILNKGMTTITYSASDSSGNPVSNICSFTVTVVDDELPQITCPTDITLNIPSSKCDTNYTYTIVQMDNCSGQQLLQTEGLGSGAGFQLGETIESYLLTDASGLTASCSFKITVLTIPEVVLDTICVGDSIFLANEWQFSAGLYIDTFQNKLTCDSIVHTNLSTTTDCYWPTEIVYVDSSATGSNTGYTWTDAYNDLQLALDVADRYLNVKEIWIAAGTYFPTAYANRAKSFVPSDSLEILGGFEGNENLKTERDPTTFKVKLSGDIGLENNTSDNSYHVLSNPDNVDNALLDGMIISDGNANGLLDIDKSGAGLLNLGKIHIRNCIFKDNISGQHGSAIYNKGISALLVLENNQFHTGNDILLINTAGATISFLESNWIY